MMLERNKFGKHVARNGQRTKFRLNKEKTKIMITSKQKHTDLLNIKIGSHTELNKFA